MKMLHGFIGFALSIMILALGWFLVAGVFGIQYAYWEALINNRLWQFVLGIVLMVLVILFWVSALPIGKREHFLSFDTEGGMVSISVNAVNAFLSKLANEFAGIVELRADVDALRDGAIEVRLDMSVKAGTHIQRLSQALQQRVRESMRESLGIADVASVKVNVQDIIATVEPASNDQNHRSDWQEAGT